MKKTLLSLLLVFSCTPLIGSQSAENPDSKKINKTEAPSWQDNFKLAVLASTWLSILGGTLDGKKCFKPVVTCTVFGGMFAIGRQLRYQSPFDMREVCTGMVIGTGVGLGAAYLWQAIKKPAGESSVRAPSGTH
jgi:hypothetical protein